MFAIYDIATGKIQSQQSQPFVTAGQAVFWVGTAEPDFRQRFYILDNDLVDRPAPPVFPARGTAPMTVDLAQIAPGSVMTVMNSDGETITLTEFTETLVLTGADIYRVELHQPFPHRDAMAAIEVTHA